MNRIKATIISGALVLTLAAGGLSACGKVDGTATAFTVNDETLSIGTANFWLRYQQAQTYSMMANYGLSTEDLWESDYTSTSSDDRNYGETYRDGLAEDIEKYMLVRQHAAEYKVTIPEDVQSAIDTASKAAMEENADIFKKMGVSEANVREMFELISYYRLMYEPMVVDTDTEVSDEEAAQTTVTYVRLSTSKTDDEGNTVEATEEDNEAWRAELQAILDAAKESEDVASADLSAIVEEQESSAFATTYSYGSDDASLPDEVKEVAASLADGDLYDGIIETEGYFYLVRLDAAFDREATDAEKESIIQTRKDEKFEEILQGWFDAAEITYGEAWEKIQFSDSEIYEMAATSE